MVEASRSGGGWWAWVVWAWGEAGSKQPEIQNPKVVSCPLGGRLRNKAVFGGYPQVLELVCSVSIRLVLFSVEVKDWNRRLKICEIFTAAKLLDLLADMGALVERSNLTSLFKDLSRSRQSRKASWKLLTYTLFAIDFLLIICVKLTIQNLR